MAAPDQRAAVDRFSLTVSARAEYDSNITGAAPSEALSRGLSLDDMVYTPTVSVNFNMPVSRQVFFLRGSAGYLFHDKNKSLDSERLSLDTGVKGRVSICDVVAEGNYQRSLSSMDDIVLGPTVDNILEVKTLEMQATCARRTGIGLTASVTQEWGDNDRVQLKNQDYESTTYTGGIVYSRPMFGTLTVFGRHSRIDYVHHIVGLPTPSGYDSNSGGVSFERKLGGRIDATVSTSYTSVESIGAPVTGVTASDFSGFTYSLLAHYRVTNRLSTEFMFNRGVSPSNRFGNSFDLTESYDVRGDYSFGSRISASLGYQYQKTNSKGSQLFAGNLTDSRSTIVNAGLSYRQNKRVTLNLDAAREERRANDPRFNYDNTRVGIAANVNY